jgi:hypothetical protein
LVSGLFVGTVSALVVMGLASLRWLPSDSVEFLEAGMILALGACLFGCVYGCVHALRPFRGVVWLPIVLAVCVLGAVYLALALKGIRLESCLHGSGPQESWCSDMGWMKTFYAAEIAGSLFLGFMLFSSGVDRKREIAQAAFPRSMGAVRSIGDRK